MPGLPCPGPHCRIAVVKLDAEGAVMYPASPGHNDISRYRCYTAIPAQRVEHLFHTWFLEFAPHASLQEFAGLLDPDHGAWTLCAQGLLQIDQLVVEVRS